MNEQNVTPNASHKESVSLTYHPWNVPLRRNVS